MDERLKYFKLAKDMNVKYSKDLQEKSLHVRGNINSMSLISLHKNTPEMGFSNIKNEETLVYKMDEHDKIKNPGRNTPEKSLQAWIIKEALSSPGHLLPFGEIKFITSEIAIVNDKGIKVVNDILGFSNKGELCIIELKYDRHLTRLLEQIHNFEDLVKKDVAFFKGLLEIYGFEWDGKKIRKIIVWPHNEIPRKETLTELHANMIDEFVYTTIDDSDSYRIEGGFMQ